MKIKTLGAGAVFLFLSACTGYGEHASGIPARVETESSSRATEASAATHIDYYNLGSTKNDVYGLWITQGPDAAMYYTTLGQVICNSGFCASPTGNVGRLDPSSGSFQEITLSASAYALQFTSDNALWGTEYTNNSLARMSLPLNASHVTEILLPAASSGAIPEPRTLAIGSDGNLWFTDYGAGRIGKINPLGPLLSSAMTMYNLPNGAAGTFRTRARPNGIAAGPDGNLWITDRLNGQIDKSTTSGVMTAYVPPEQAALGSSNSTFPAFITKAGGSLYFTQNNDPSSPLDEVTTGGAFSHASIPAAASPYFLASQASTIAFDDLANSGVATYRTDTHQLRDLPLTQLSAAANTGGVNGVTFASDGSVWFMCYNPLVAGGPLCAGHLVLTPTWSLFPGTAITLIRSSTRTTSQLVGIGESGDSGPFTIVSSNPSVVRVRRIAYRDHDFFLDPVGYFRAYVIVTDAHGRSQRIVVTVNRQ